MNINWLHVVNSLAGGLALVAGLDPVLFGPYAPQAAIAVGIATIGANVLHAMIAKDAPVAPPTTTAKLHSATVILTGIVIILTGAILASAIVSCKTAPTPTEQAGITVAVDIATGAAIQNGASPAGYQSRAANFKSIAVKVKAVNDAGTATLATLAADIAPLIATLPPADQLAAHALIAALTPYLNQEVAASPALQNTQATLDVILQAVIDSCGAYGA